MTLLPRIGWHEKNGVLNAFYSIDRKLGARDRVVTPGESLDRAVREVSSGGSSPDGVRLYLAPGRYFVKGSTPIQLAVDNLHIIASAPGQSIVTRSDDDAGRTMFTVSGDECSLTGIVFDDTNVSVSGARGAAIAISGDKCTVANCVFTQAVQAISSSGDYTTITGNRVRSVTDASAIQLTASASLALVYGNIIQDTGVTTAIYADDAVSKSSFVGNVAAAADAISYKTGLSNVNAGNVGTVTVRP